MKLYRLMCKTEYDRVDNTSPFSWQSKAKWFSDDIEFIKTRQGENHLGKLIMKIRKELQENVLIGNG